SRMAPTQGDYSPENREDRLGKEVFRFGYGLNIMDTYVPNHALVAELAVEGAQPIGRGTYMGRPYNVVYKGANVPQDVNVEREMTTKDQKTPIWSTMPVINVPALLGADIQSLMGKYWSANDLRIPAGAILDASIPPTVTMLGGSPGFATSQIGYELWVD